MRAQKTRVALKLIVGCAGLLAATSCAFGFFSYELTPAQPAAGELVQLVESAADNQRDPPLQPFTSAAVQRHYDTFLLRQRLRPSESPARRSL
ncbi:MAG: hypothetical protein ABI846_14570 [Rudaea sp.]